MSELTGKQGRQLSSGISAFEAKEFPSAWGLLEPLSEQGIADAQYRCAMMMQNGLGVVARPQAAAQLMLCAAEQGLGLAQHAYGIMCLFGEGVASDAGQAVLWLERAGESGLAGAWSTLGSLYREGECVEKDIEKARDCFEKAGINPDECV